MGSPASFSFHGTDKRMRITDLLSKFHDEEELPGGYNPAVKSLRLYLGNLPPQTMERFVLRASGFSFLCPREFVLNYWNPVPVKSFDWGSHVKMNIGTDLHTYLQNYVMGPMGVLYGKWQSIDGDSTKVIEGFHPDPERTMWEMVEQKPLTWHFVEERMWDEKWRIRGHIDGRVSKKRLDFLSSSSKLMKEDMPSAIKRCMDIEPEEHLPLYEIKSTGTYAFKGITDVAKIPEYYKMQASIYQWLSGTNETIFLYLERDNIKMRGFSYKGEKGWIKDAKRKARIVWESIRDEVLPESAMSCKSPDDKRAKSCVFREECWLPKFDFKSWLNEKRDEGVRLGRKFLDLSKETWDD